jgi:hypothetical protein
LQLLSLHSHHHGRHPLTGLNSIFKIGINSRGVLCLYMCTSAATIMNS